ncbi:MAG: tyrosine-type recombinase/integrase [Gemmataceae bacterium]
MSDRTRIPKYRKKKTPSGNYAVVTLPDGLGGRSDVLLGKYGTKESRAEYARVLAEWEVRDRRRPATAADITVDELLAAWLPWAQDHYRYADGTATQELKEYKLSLRSLRVMYGCSPARRFSPLALKAVRENMIEAGLARGVINQRIARIRRIWKWAVENELVPPDVLHGLQAVRGLQRGRSKARETEPVKPVPVAHVEETLQYLTPTLADMAMLQLYTGMRSGELCIIRAADLDMTGAVWLFHPVQHKTLHQGKKRIIAIGPRGQEIVRRHLKPDLQAYLFSPRESAEEMRERSRAQRRTKVYPCETKRVAAKKRSTPRLRFGDKYKPSTYSVAIRKAITRANQKREAEGLAPIPYWHPHQLRHAAATKARREAGLDAARALLGHSSPVIADHYAELDILKAVELVARIG